MTKQLGCNYEAPTFGASYPDGRCLDGYMWDLDACDGRLLIGGPEMACPYCNTREHIEDTFVGFSGNSHQRRKAIRKKIKEIREWAHDRSSFPPDGGPLY